MKVCDSCGDAISEQESYGTLIIPFSKERESKSVVLFFCIPCAHDALADARSHRD